LSSLGQPAELSPVSMMIKGEGVPLHTDGFWMHWKDSEIQISSQKEEKKGKDAFYHVRLC
jgi:hypothetical protein